MTTMKSAPELTFEDLTFTVKDKKGKKAILNNICGTFPSGKLIAILGPSGAGKTTLLNILSGWNKNAFSGSIRVDDEERVLKDFKKRSCYITQDSHLVDVLSVEENLKFAADLKLGGHVTKASKQNVINEIVKSFGLTKHLKTTTGKLSGGQKKRLAICLELLNDPDVMFLDEPTTGLDSVFMYKCMRHLKQLAEKGNSVICTLHQPPGGIVQMFDIVYVIAHGQCAYQGSPEHLVRFLVDSGLPCEIFHSPLDYVVEIANNDYGEKALESLLEASDNGKCLSYMPPLLIHRQNGDPRRTAGNIFTKWSDYSFFDDFYELRSMLLRDFVRLKRDTFLTYLRVIGVLFSCISTGITCYDIGNNATMVYFNYNTMLLHNSLVVLGFGVFTAVGFVLNQEVVRNEYENGYFSIRNYFLTTMILDLPVTIGSVTIGAFAFYWLSGQWMTWGRILMFLFLSIELAMVASSLGFLIGTLFKFNIAVFLVTSMHIPIFVVSGYGLTITDMPRVFYYLSYLAYTRFSVRSFMGITFGYDRPPYHCPEDAPYCHYRNSALFLSDMGLEDFYYVYDALVLGAFYFFIRFLAYLAVRYRLKGGKYVD